MSSPGVVHKPAVGVLVAAVVVAVAMVVAVVTVRKFERSDAEHDDLRGIADAPHD
jgi:hypothetical protein